MSSRCLSTCIYPRGIRRENLTMNGRDPPSDAEGWGDFLVFHRDPSSLALV